MPVEQENRMKVRTFHNDKYLHGVNLGLVKKGESAHELLKQYDAPYRHLVDVSKKYDRILMLVDDGKYMMLRTTNVEVFSHHFQRYRKLNVSKDHE